MKRHAKRALWITVGLFLGFIIVKILALMHEIYFWMQS